MSDTRAIEIPTVTPAIQAWHKLSASYSQPDNRRAAIQLLNTVLPLLASVAALIYGLGRGFWPAALFALPAALFLVRLFAIQHDCGHGSFLKSRRINDAVGRILGTVTLIPYAFWRQDHAVHHATSGNLDRRGTGDIKTLTVGEYRASSFGRKLLYRLYRHPLVLFGLGPAYMLLVRYRFPFGDQARDWRNWLSTLGTSAAGAAIVAGLAFAAGSALFLAVWGTTIFLAAMIGIWLFYVQHQFEDVYWQKAARWDFHAAAFAGSSFYDLPFLLRWFTGSIGFHHIHHFASKIPNYRLRECFEQNPEFQNAKRLTLWDSVRSLRLALWDEERAKLISFRQAAPPA